VKIGNYIPQKVLDKIFQPFLTTKPTRQGTVLRLCYDMVEADGARFFIKLSKQTVTL